MAYLSKLFALEGGGGGTTNSTNQISLLHADALAHRTFDPRECVVVGSQSSPISNHH